MIKPLIGIGSDVLHIEGERDRAFTYLSYTEALRKAGAVPVLIPPQPENARELVQRLDGVLLAGGFDCDPAVYGEACHATVEPMDARRQENDYALAKHAREVGIPTLGVCLGLQMMNVAAGGTLIQDIDSHLDTQIQHASEPSERSRHDIRVEPGTRLASLVSDLELNVNSSHHQAVGRVGAGLRVTALAPDGIVEGIEDPGHPFYLGVQWHPEDMSGERSAGVIFDAFVAAARQHALAKHQATDLSPAVEVVSE